MIAWFLAADPEIVGYGANQMLSAVRRLAWAPKLDSPERFRIFALPIEVVRE